MTTLQDVKKWVANKTLYRKNLAKIEDFMESTFPKHDFDPELGLVLQMPEMGKNRDLYLLSSKSPKLRPFADIRILEDDGLSNYRRFVNEKIEEFIDEVYAKKRTVVISKFAALIGIRDADKVANATALKKYLKSKAGKDSRLYNKIQDAVETGILVPSSKEIAKNLEEILEGCILQKPFQLVVYDNEVLIGCPLEVFLKNPKTAFKDTIKEAPDLGFYLVFDYRIAKDALL